MEPIYIILLCVVAFVAVLHVLSNRRAPRIRTNEVRIEAVQGQAARQVDPLVAACFGDRAKADRLTLYEKKKDPFIADAEARKRALERLTADRR